MFEKVFGHNRIKAMLQRMVAKDSLHHGLCFHGPNGIGKRLLAHEVAKAMLCEQRTGSDACRHCQKFEHGNHPDFAEVVPDGANIKVHQIRDISENLHFRPFEGRVRVIVLDQVELMREEAANAFLKSLEEPPDYVYFILICADLKSLLPTILSRCQKIAFQSLQQEDKAKILMTGFGKDEVMAQRLARISFRQLETEDEAWRQFQEDVKQILAYLNTMLTEGHGLDYFSDLVRDKAMLPRFLDHLTATVRELTLLSFQLPPQPLFETFAPAMQSLAGQCERGLWREFWTKIVRLHGQRRLNLNLPLWLNASSVTDLGSLEKAEQVLKQRLARV